MELLGFGSLVAVVGELASQDEWMALPREENAELRRQGWEVTSVTRHGISSIPRMNGPCRRPCAGALEG